MNPFTTPIPEFYKSLSLQPDDILRINSEEEALVWLWVKPELFPWPCPVEWVLSPLTGKDKWPGDLWGIDSHGELLIIENKLYMGGSTYDPFVDFSGHWNKRKSECSADSIVKKWCSLLKFERRAPSRLVEPCEVKKGVLPHSRKCSRLQRWPELTKEMEQRVWAAPYEKTVRDYLDERRKNQNCPHYCGLVVKVKPGNNSPLNSFQRSIANLQEEVGADHVHLFEVCAHVRTNELLDISVTAVEVGTPQLSAKHHG